MLPNTNAVHFCDFFPDIVADLSRKNSILFLSDLRLYTVHLGRGNISEIPKNSGNIGLLKSKPKSKSLVTNDTFLLKNVKQTLKLKFQKNT